MAAGPDTDPMLLLSKLHAALKPGGVVVVQDHVANPGGDPAKVVDSLHRIDPSLVKRDFEKAGFVFDGDSALLAHPGDDHLKLVFDEAIRGKTDQFLFRFRKPGREPRSAARRGAAARDVVGAAQRLDRVHARRGRTATDTLVVDEPFYAHYLDYTGLDHPGRDEVIAAHESDWRRVVSRAARAGAAKGSGSCTRSRCRITCCRTWGASGWAR